MADALSLAVAAAQFLPDLAHSFELIWERNRLTTYIVRTEHVKVWPQHHYISTACLHDLHQRCRRTCKFCNSTCLCKICRHA